MRKFSRMLVAMMAVAIVSASARTEAALILQLSDGTNTVTVLDNGAGDANADLGAVTFIGGVGNFTTNVTTGLSQPILPSSESLAWMDLNSVNVSSTGPGTLTIGLIDTDFLATGDGTLFASVGGTTTGSVSFAGLKCEFGDTQEPNCPVSILLGPFSGGAFSDEASASHGPLGPYGMVLLASVFHGEGVNSTSFDFELRNVPEPTSMALLGLGLLGFGAVSRRRKLAR